MTRPALLPAVSSLRDLDGPGFTLRPESTIVAAGDSSASAAGAVTVAEYLAGLLRPRTGFGLAVVTARSADAAAITLTIERSSGPAEGYLLRADADGIDVTAPSAAGLFHGVQTLRQLFPAAIEARLDGTSQAAHGIDWVTPVVQITDAPRFGYRGAMLDVARNVYSVADVKRYIDDIALLKLNVLHLHLTDDQGWRLQIQSWPRLTEIGGSTSVLGGGGFYTQADYSEIVDYAASRFVTIVPEIDMPGHTNAALASYPELNIGGAAAAPYRGTEVGMSTLDTTAEATWRFVEDVVREVAAITPGPYLHLGGDESLQLSAAEFTAFVSRASTLGAATGKTIIGWHEMGKSGDLASGTIGQYWDYVTPRADAAALTRSFVEQGGRVIMSPADVSYLDIHYPDTDRLGQDWADGPTSIEAAYSWDPATVVPGVEEADVLGVEAPIWTETMNGIADVEFMAFPRIVPIAEIAWSNDPGAARRFDEFAPRLVAFAERLDALGIGYHRSPELDWR